MSTLTSSRPDLVFAAINMNVDGRPLEVGFYTQPVPIDTRNLKPWLSRRSSGRASEALAGVSPNGARLAPLCFLSDCRGRGFPAAGRKSLVFCRVVKQGGHFELR